MAAPPGWHAHTHGGGGGGPDYTCPGCHRFVPRNSQHVVAWPDDDEERRRHWHTGCWKTAVNQGLDRYRWT